ncbi:MAG TPA: hypothetical protein VIF62_07245, partial [Labilithrix sp.]
PLVEHHLAAALGTRGAIVRVRDRLVWFERVAEEPTRRLVWLRACSGALEELASTRVGAAHEVLAELASRGVLDDRANHDDDDALAAAHARLFPKGFALVVGRAPPETFAALAPSMRQAVWSDALRDLRRRRGGGAAKSQRAWYVTAHAPDGPIRAIFGAPRPVDPAKAEAWRSELLKTRATGAKRDIVAQ